MHRALRLAHRSCRSAHHVAQRWPQQLGCCLVAGQAPARLDDLPVPHVQALDHVGHAAIPAKPDAPGSNATSPESESTPPLGARIEAAGVGTERWTRRHPIGRPGEPLPAGLFHRTPPTNANGLMEILPIPLRGEPLDIDTDFLQEDGHLVNPRVHPFEVPFQPCDQRHGLLPCECRRLRHNAVFLI